MMFRIRWGDIILLFVNGAEPVVLDLRNPNAVIRVLAAQELVLSADSQEDQDIRDDMQVATAMAEAQKSGIASLLEQLNTDGPAQ